MTSRSAARYPAAWRLILTNFPRRGPPPASAAGRGALHAHYTAAFPWRQLLVRRQNPVTRGLPRATPEPGLFQNPVTPSACPEVRRRIRRDVRPVVTSRTSRQT